MDLHLLLSTMNAYHNSSIRRLNALDSLNCIDYHFNYRRVNRGVFLADSTARLMLRLLIVALVSV